MTDPVVISLTVRSTIAMLVDLSSSLQPMRTVKVSGKRPATMAELSDCVMWSGLLDSLDKGGSRRLMLERVSQWVLCRMFDGSIDWWIYLLSDWLIVCCYMLFNFGFDLRIRTPNCPLSGFEVTIVDFGIMYIIGLPVAERRGRSLRVPHYKGQLYHQRRRKWSRRLVGPTAHSYFPSCDIPDDSVCTDDFWMEDHTTPPAPSFSSFSTLAQLLIASQHQFTNDTVQPRRTRSRTTSDKFRLLGRNFNAWNRTTYSRQCTSRTNSTD